MKAKVTEEEWRPIEKFNGEYLISNLGNMKSIPRQRVCKNGLVLNYPGRDVKTRINSKGYWAVTIHYMNKVYEIKIHIQVATAFIPNPENKPQVNHIDGNRANPIVSNLEWVTAKENQLHSFKCLGRKGSRLGMTGKDCPESIPVRAINLITKQEVVYDSITLAHQATKVRRGTITRVLREDRPTRNKIWQFKTI